MGPFSRKQNAKYLSIMPDINLVYTQSCRQFGGGGFFCTSASICTGRYICVCILCRYFDITVKIRTFFFQRKDNCIYTIASLLKNQPLSTIIHSLLTKYRAMVLLDEANTNFTEPAIPGRLVVTNRHVYRQLHDCYGCQYVSKSFCATGENISAAT